MLELTGVSKSFGKQKVLNDVSLTVEEGTVTYLLGRSGQGKSVTLRLLLGLLEPDSGEVRVDNIVVSHRSETERKPARELCGMVFQFPALFDSMTVGENFAFAWKLRGRARNGWREPAEQALDAVHLPADVLGRLPQNLSTAEQKRASLARAVLLQPRYLLFDEPTTGLDPEAGWAVTELVEELARKKKVTALVVSHDVHFALATADRLLVLDGGKWIFDGDREAFRKSRNPIVHAFAEEATRRAEGAR